MLECKIGRLGPQRGWLPWATQQMTNDGRSLAVPITADYFFAKLAVQTLKQSGIFKLINNSDIYLIIYCNELAFNL